MLFVRINCDSQQNPQTPNEIKALWILYGKCLTAQNTIRFDHFSIDFRFYGEVGYIKAHILFSHLIEDQTWLWNFLCFELIPKYAQYNLFYFRKQIYKEVLDLDCTLWINEIYFLVGNQVNYWLILAMKTKLSLLLTLLLFNECIHFSA